MYIATTLHTYLDETNEDVGKALSLAKEDGFDAIGVTIKEPIVYYLEKKEELLNSDLRLCVHANQYDTNLASMNEGIRKESVKQLKDAILLAKEIGSKVVTFHPGKYRNIHHVKESYFLLDQSLKECLGFAEENGVVICLENMEPGYSELCISRTQIELVLKRHPKLMLTMDFAHLARVCETKEDVLDFYNTFKGRIRHFHISGKGHKVSHVEVSLKESEFDFTDIIKEINSTENSKVILRIENRERHKNIESLEFIRKALA